jgi:nucleoside-triphosphatase THEP1
MELASAGFADEVTKCLETRRVVGTIQARPHPILDAIKSRQDVELIIITKANRNEIPNLVINRIRNQYGESYSRS